IVVIGAIAAAIGPVILVMGMLVSSIGTIVGAFGTVSLAIAEAGGIMALLSTKLGFLGTAFSALSGPVGIAIAAVVAIGAALVTAYNKVDWFREGVNKTFDSIKSFTTTIFDGIKKTITSLLSSAVDLAKGTLDDFKNFWNENGKFITSIVKAYMNNVKTNIEMVLGIIKGIFQAVFPIIASVVKVAFETVKFAIKNAMDLILGTITLAMKLIQGDWRGAWESIKKIAQDIMENIKSYFKGIDLKQIGKDIINGLIEGLGSMVTSVKKKVESIANSIPDWAKKVLGIKSPSRVFAQIGRWISEGWAIGIEEKGSMVENAVSDIALNAKDIAEHYVSEEKKLRSKANADIAKIETDKASKIATIEKRMHEDVAKAQRSAASKKKKSTQDDALKIQRIREDAVAKIAKLEETSSAQVEKIKADSTKKIFNLESEMNKTLLEETKRYIDDKKSLDQLSIIEEAHIWEQSMRLFAEGTKERVAAQQEYKKASEAVNKEITAINTDFQG
ncbi:MAG: hypothetical protein ACI35V_05595, partial [Sphingobacterium composti]